MAKARALTNKRYEYFHHCVVEALELLSLHDWDVTVRKMRLKDSYAETNLNYPARSATICVNSIDRHGDDDLELQDTAYHEVVEILLYALEHTAHRRMAKDNIDSARHSTIHRLIRLMLNYSTLKKERR